MAVRDGAPFLAAAIESILAQTVRDLELVVVDDASADASRAIVAGYRDPRIVLLENSTWLGLARSLNRGLAVARAELIARQDADDVSVPRRLEQQLALLRARPDVAIVGARGFTVDGATVRPLDRPLDPVAVRWFHLFENPFIHSAVVFRRGVVGALGGYDESLPWAQDWDLWSRVLARHTGLNLADRLVRWRERAGSVTASARDAGRHAALARRVLAANVERTLGIALTDAEADLLAGYGTALDRRDAAAFFALVRRLAARFADRHPGTALATEPARTIAHQIDAVAARAHPAGRRSVLAVYRAAFGHVPAARRWFPWRRAALRLCLGPAGIRRVRRWGTGPLAPGLRGG
jgi:glycosyltransferase involved in cell wall biosynthesis